AIPDGSAVRSLAARDGAWDAHKLGAHLSGRHLHLRVAVTSKIYEFEVRSEIRVGQRTSALEVEALCVFEARTDAVPQQHVERPVWLRAGILVSQIQRS